MPVFLSTAAADFEARFAAMLAAKREDSADVGDVVAGIIAEVRARGDAALVAQTYADSLAVQRAAREGGRPSGGSGGPRRRHEAAVQQVEVVRSRFRFDDYYGGDVLPHRETVLSRCEVGGTAVAVREERTADEIAGGVAR